MEQSDKSSAEKKQYVGVVGGVCKLCGNAIKGVTLGGQCNDCLSATVDTDIQFTASDILTLSESGDSPLAASATATSTTGPQGLVDDDYRRNLRLSRQQSSNPVYSSNKRQQTGRGKLYRNRSSQAIYKYGAAASVGKSRKTMAKEKAKNKIVKRSDTSKDIIEPFPRFIHYGQQLYQIGDVVSLTDIDTDKKYYAQIHMLHREYPSQEVKASIGWLLPRKPNEKFHLESYTSGPVESMFRSLNELSFVCRCSLEYFHESLVTNTAVTNEPFTYWATPDTLMKDAATSLKKHQADKA